MNLLNLHALHKNTRSDLKLYVNIGAVSAARLVHITLTLLGAAATSVLSSKQIFGYERFSVSDGDG